MLSSVCHVIEVSAFSDRRNYFLHNDGLKFVGVTEDSVDIETKAKQWIERQLWRYKTNQYGLLALRDKQTNALVGQCGLLTQEVDGMDELEIGYHVLPQHWGRVMRRKRLICSGNMHLTTGFVRR